MKNRSSLCRILNVSLVLFSVIIFNSCNGYKQLPYLKDAGVSLSDTLTGLAIPHEPCIMPNDIISITVNSTVPGAASSFNMPAGTGSSDGSISTSTSTGTSGNLQNYLVDRDGRINFPLLGELKLGGMTVKEAQYYIVSLIYPRYIAEKPIVNIRFTNFEVSVLGEVAKPGIYKSVNGQMTILDALAAAGDMTVYGKRNNVLLVRIQDNGDVATHRIDIQDKDIIQNRNLFYMQQNDKLYVETNKAKGNNSRFGTFETIGLSALSILISIIAIATR
ncbi:polysaccharide export outer membrane protein [Dysgonomonas sp. PFB1-18]|uniref:polysaccharide biosynthesis/export family protein n=1 Tax=unclassified Dysgonomonas TaxID=2630389 RepID=UPI0024769AB3|nr:MULTISPECIES: polysaccharide biosynthesis/export family protein [unclassified Dysgonomonas]MDL2303394.1 polysaccharide biosynthesis/export family protein [Dysgonomonas sp. OttesenSCG-928-D17]MDH6307780.1 polysaccharide export outer membrane protein [Dysgonomonas sp. PF1-14]MDH6337698.1 polysaccharide export outer membrane protein [Dysgonomonas sp. PF1-16]MDH6378922.1 polysaccharide export outer membrane protein [Dysgonomonas sp. PFB1-18]MDH6396557.1 polysaccharide export outer membrane prot